MTCGDALLALSADLDGELSDQEKQALQAHLDACPACRALREELSGLHSACGALDAEAPPQLKERVLAGLPPRKGGKVLTLHWRRWASLAAAVVLVLVGIWAVPRALSGSGSSGDANMMAARKLNEAPAGDLPVPLADEATVQAADEDMPPYVNGPAVSANAAPVPAPDQSAKLAEATGYDAFDSEEAPPELEAAADDQEVTADLSAGEAPTPFFASISDEPNDEDMDDLEAVVGSSVLTADPPDSIDEAPADSPLYMATLTLPTGTPLLDPYQPDEVREDGALLYVLSGEAFQTLLAELTADGAEYTLSADEGDTDQVLVVVLAAE